MRFRTVTLAAALAASAVIVPATLASAAAETSPEVAWVNNNVIVNGSDPNTAYIQAKYSCEGEGVHLWTSVKQGPEISEENSTSDFAVSWYETPEGPVPNCDGKTHVTRFAVSLADGWEPLVSGPAWVQFVFFYVNSAGEVARAADVGWATVKAPAGH
jgi:hypothetical protein